MLNTNTHLDASLHTRRTFEALIEAGVSWVRNDIRRGLADASSHWLMDADLGAIDGCDRRRVSMSMLVHHELELEWPEK